MSCKEGASSAVLGDEQYVEVSGFHSFVHLIMSVNEAANDTRFHTLFFGLC